MNRGDFLRAQSNPHSTPRARKRRGIRYAGVSESVRLQEGAAHGAGERLSRLVGALAHLSLVLPSSLLAVRHSSYCGSKSGRFGHWMASPRKKVCMAGKKRLTSAPRQRTMTGDLLTTRNLRPHQPGCGITSIAMCQNAMATFMDSVSPHPCGWRGSADGHCTERRFGGRSGCEP